MNYSAKIKALSNAINFHNPVEITYREESESRKICPYVVYNNAKGVSTLDAWQMTGKTNSENLKFKQFHVEQIKSIVVLSNELFTLDKTYNPDSTRYINSFLKIEGQI